MATIPAKSQNANRSNMFGSFPDDPNHHTIQQWQNYFLTQDATGTPVTSPQTVSNVADTVLTIPAAATELVIYSSAALRVNDASPASAPYFVIPATTVFKIPVVTPTNSPVDANTGVLYLRGDAGSCTVQFMFLCV